MKDLSASWSEPILCETATEGEFAQVSLKRRTCCCQEFAQVKSCEHLRSVNKWLGKHWDRYVALSGLQKSIRRCDSAMVFAWAKILLAHQSEESLSRHISRLIFEESRAFPLFIRMRKKELSIVQALDWVATVAKKWELPYLNSPSHVGNWHEGFRKSFSRQPPLPLEFGQMVRSAKDPADVYALYFDLRRDPRLHHQLWDHLDDVATQTKNERLAVFLKHQPETKYEALAAMELMLNIYDAQAKERHTSNFTGREFIPRAENHPYIHDMHTAHGKALWIRSFAEAWRTKNFEFGDLQGNFSGSVISVLWRERCFAQKGSMKRPDGRFWAWSDIVIEDEDYAKALDLERHFYPQILARVENQHPNLLPRSD